VAQARPPAVPRGPPPSPCRAAVAAAEQQELLLTQQQDLLSQLGEALARLLLSQQLWRARGGGRAVLADAQQQAAALQLLLAQLHPAVEGCERLRQVCLGGRCPAWRPLLLRMVCWGEGMRGGERQGG